MNRAGGGPNRGGWRGRDYHHGPPRGDQRRDHRGQQYMGGPPQPPAPRVRYLSRDELTRLAGSSGAEVVQCLNENMAGFLAAYKHPPNCTHPLTLKHLVKILFNLISSQEENLASRALGQILSLDGEFALFILQIGKLVMEMPGETRWGIRGENLQYLKYLIDIGKFAIEKIPTTVVSTFPTLQIKNAIEGLHRKGEHVDLLRADITHLLELFSSAEDTIFEEKMPKQVPAGEEEAGQPPEPFTEVEILPSSKELEDCSKKPFLRANKVKGAYENWDHYLDVQFRLLREDFVAPLRNGIQCWYEGNKTADVYIYYSVRVLDPVCLFQGVGFTIHFDPMVRSLARVNWEHSRRLIFGSLLCLSKDEFKTMVFATVMKRDVKVLADGFLTIKFEGQTNGFEINPGDEFIMVESTAYFEAYRHILEGLKSVSVRADSMPFKPYIVECSLENIPAPSYIKNPTSASFDLKEALGIVRSAHARVTVTDLSTWPHVSNTSLDKSQLAAIQMALKQEISIIQGPPGTGKTYIGLKIVQAFLQNRNAWDRLRSCPILVVCYTNHALDQFLEGIKECRIDGREPNIVRIGGRCKSEKLADCVLFKKVQNARAAKAFPRNIYFPYIRARENMLEGKNTIEEAVENIGSTDGRILTLSTLERVIPPHFKLQLTHGIETEGGKEIEVWLGLWLPRPQEDHMSDSEPEDDELEKAIEASMADLGVSNDQQRENDGNADVNELIEVDEEARLLEEDRILEGEEIEFGSTPRRADSTEENPKKKRRSGWQVKQLSDRERRRRIERGFQNRPMRAEAVQRVDNLHALAPEEKWSLYHYWAHEHLKEKKRQLAALAEGYNQDCNTYCEQQQNLHSFVVQGADVIGMTTTGAAKHHHIFQKVFPRIVVVEEAAEVFESHVVTSLSPSVQQLILIGDHKQLRPKPNHYELERKYGFAVSLFERLANNGIPFTTLEVQHRMRPEIAQLVHPHIYPHLENHPSVTGYEHIKGVGKDIFFIDHRNSEDHNKSGDMRSHSNAFEANYLVSLCHYLLKQGYKPSQVTVLTMYRGQLLELKRRMRREDFQGVRVTAVDDFQGEENDIILLSLVRSNSDGDVGFLKIQNRVCVSLSRARMGLYVIGNLAMLRDKDNTVWPQIIADMEKKQCIGKALPLYCQNHPREKNFVEKAEDFSKCPEGGCHRPCGVRLLCGHACKRICHPYDQDHKLYKCQNPCPRTLACGHRCKRRCHECTDQCQPCREPVQKVIPGCGHQLQMPCHINPTQVLCTHQCTKILPCGHFCQENCHEPCTWKCNVKVDKSLPCGHTTQDACCRKPENIICPAPCKDLLDCEHHCGGTCGQCHQGRLHIRCRNKCDRQLVCGHICKFPCTPNCPPCMQKCTNYCVHSQCHKECYQPCAPCMEPCPWQCVHLRCTSRCGEPCNRPPCNEPCTKLLRCGHSCIGLCGEKCPQLCLVCNRAEVLEVFFDTEEEDARYIELQDCGHVLEVEGLDDWIEMSDEDAPNAVQLKCCPKCKTPIRKSLRYGNTIKQTLRDMEEVKKKQLVAGVDHLQAKIQEIETSSGSSIARDLGAIKASITPPRGHKGLHHISPHVVNTIQNQLNFLPEIAKVHQILDSIKTNYLHLGQGIEVHEVKSDVSTLQQFLMQTFLSSQQLSDIQCELRRLSYLAKLCDLQFKVTTKQCQVSASDRQALDSLSVLILESGWKSPKMKDDQLLEQQVTILIKRFNQIYSTSGLSEKERIEIVKAIERKKGRWFKCPNGHYYCIGECGGAMEIAKCPDCGVRIGGTRHRLLDDNQFAGEMDGASHPAWSDAANMENYQF